MRALWILSAIVLAACGGSGNNNGATPLPPNISTPVLALSTDASSPGFANAAGRTTGVLIGAIKLRASEMVNLQKVTFQLTKGRPSDLSLVHIDYQNQVMGTATFVGNNTTATSTLNASIVLPASQDVTIQVRADVAAIGAAQPATEGDFVAVDVASVQGVGVSSGNIVTGTLSGPGSTGIRIFHSIPSLTQDSLPSTGLSDGRLLRFRVMAYSLGPVGLGKLTLSVASTSVTNLSLHAFTDPSYSQPVSGQGVSGQIGASVPTSANGSVFSFQPSSPLQVAPGTSLYFELRGSVQGASAVTTLLGDSAASPIDTFAKEPGNFIWSGNAMWIASYSDGDWTNGASLSGLPPSGIVQNRSN